MSELAASSEEAIEVSTTPAPEFSNDRSLSSKADDKLNRAAFAERVAGVLRSLPKGTGLVVGIHGPWGDGKTSVLNILRDDLKANDNKIIVREFNPWRLTDEESMLRGFFGMLAEAINKSLATKVEQTKAAAAKWTKPVRWVTKPLGWLWKPAETADDLLARIGAIAASGDTVALDELRGRINKHLKDSDKQIVVLVDDIDRLDKHETHTLFRLIKACADFPNVCYVLAFDDVAVAKSLGERYGGGDEASGRAFLEKIIQVPLKLPVAMPEDLRALCLDQVERALNAAGVELSKEEVGGFLSGFDRGISIRLDTPRAAKRYGNALMFALPLLKGEVNTVDLLLLEALRAFYPAIYDCIRADHSEFSGVESERRGRGNDGPRGAALLQPIIKAMPEEEQEAVKSLLKGLFPRLGTAYGGGGYGSSWLDTWNQAKNLSSPDYCPRYFTYAVPKSDVRDSEMDALYMKAASGAESEVLSTIEGFFTSGKARRVIQRMRQREKNTDPHAVPPLCLAVASLAKHLPNPPSLFSFAEAPHQAGMLITNLIKQLPTSATRVDLAKRVIGAADPLWFGDVCLRWLHVTDDA
ncbi:MAG: P-loop NTPase fold protein, partial [bacterium]